MFHFKHWLGGTAFIVSADVARFVTPMIVSRNEGVYGDWSSDQIVSALLVPFHALAFVGLILLGTQLHLQAARRWSKWVALVPFSILLGSYLSSGDGIAAVVSPWIAAPLMSAGVLVGSWLVWRFLEAAVAVKQPVLRNVVKGGLFACAVALLAIDLNVYVGLYLPLHVLLGAASVGLAMIAIDEDFGLSKPKISFVALILVVAALASIPLTRQYAPLTYMGAMEMGSATVQNARLWFALTSWISRPTPPNVARSSASTEVPMTDGLPSIVIISLDGLRYDHTSLAGYVYDTTPALAKMAQNAWAWTRAYSPSARTDTSLKTLFSGGLNKTCDVGQDLFLTAKNQTYRTFCDFPYSRTTLNCHALACDGLMDTRSRDHTYSVLLNELAISDEPVFAFVHLLETHVPYEDGVSDALRARTQGWSEYDRAVLASDEAMQRFVQSAIGVSTRPVVFVIMSDHGESLGDHGRVGHDSSVFSEQIHVPLLLYMAGMAPKRFSMPVSTVWLGPTLFAMMGVGAEGGLPTQKDDRPVFASNDSWQTVIEGQWKYVINAATGELWLFDLSNDPKELQNAMADHPEVVERLADLLNTQFGH